MTGDPFVPRRKIYRKRKKSEGQSWQPDTDELDKAKRDKGPLCKSCHKVRRWGKLEFAYEQLADGTIQRVMYCDGCGNALQVDEVGKSNKKLTRDNCIDSIITSPPMPGKEEPMTETPGYSAKEAAIQLGTDARTLRKFLRSKQSPIDPVGQGARYTFTAKDIKKLRKAFDKWSTPTAKQIKEAVAPVDHVDEDEVPEIEVDDDAEDDWTIQEPADDELLAIVGDEYEPPYEDFDL